MSENWWSRLEAQRAEDITRQMIALNETMTQAEIAKRYGITRQRVSQRFKKADYKPKRHPKPKRYNRTLRWDEQVIELYQQHKVREVAEILGISVRKVYRILKVNHQKLRGNVVSKLPPTQELLKMLRTQTAQEIANRYSVTRGNIYTRLRKAGLQSPSSKRKRQIRPCLDCGIKPCYARGLCFYCHRKLLRREAKKASP